MKNYFKDVYVDLIPIYRSKGRGRKKVLKYRKSIKRITVHLSGTKNTWVAQRAIWAAA